MKSKRRSVVFVLPDPDLDGPDLDRYSSACSRVIERSGEAWLTTTVLHGRRAMRVNINSFLTEQHHIDDLVKLLVRSKHEAYRHDYEMDCKLLICFCAFVPVFVSLRRRLDRSRCPQSIRKPSLTRISVTYDANTPYALAARDVRDRSQRQQQDLLRQQEALQLPQRFRQRHVSLARTRRGVFREQLPQAKPALHPRHARISNSAQALDL